MKEVLFYVFLAIFVATAIITILGVIRKVDIKPNHLNVLFSALIIELVGSVIGLYKVTNFFDDESQFVRFVKANQQEYIWKNAKIRFSYPRTGWSIDTKRSSNGLGDLALVTSDISTQIQLHYSALDPKYVNKWDLFLSETKGLWQQTLSPHGTVSVNDVFIDGFKGFRLKGFLPGSTGLLKKVDVVYVPINNEFFIEAHYTRNADSNNASNDEAYEILLSTLLVED